MRTAVLLAAGPRCSMTPDGATAAAAGLLTATMCRTARCDWFAAARDVKAANQFGVTPLSLACTNGNAAMVGLLLKAGADPNTALPEGETVLMTAARTGKPEVVKVLLASGAEVNRKKAGAGKRL